MLKPYHGRKYISTPHLNIKHERPHKHTPASCRDLQNIPQNAHATLVPYLTYPEYSAPYATFVPYLFYYALHLVGDIFHKITKIKNTSNTKKLKNNYNYIQWGLSGPGDVALSQAKNLIEIGKIMGALAIE